jgi:tetratricopeptide (TPR) repeat protein
MNRNERRKAAKTGDGDAQDLLRRATEAHKAGRLEQAESLYQRAIDAAPGQAAARHWYGLFLKDKGDLAGAARELAEALRLMPQDVGARLNLGSVCYDLGRHADALRLFEESVAMRPDLALGWRNLGMALLALYRLEEALPVLRRGLALDPNDNALHFQLGNAFLSLGEHDNAIAAFRRAIALHPGHYEAFGNLSSAFMFSGRLNETEEALRESLRINPDYAGSQVGMAHLHLLRGEYEEGWAWHDGRIAARDVLFKEFTHLGLPNWKGEKLAGRTLLIYDEQGLGDAIHFARYAPLAAQAANDGGKVVFAVRPVLRRLFSSLPSIELVSLEEDLPRFDLHCPLLTLPRFFGPFQDTPPPPAPYLQVADALVAQWKERLGPGPGLKVGLCWAGNSAYLRDRERSVPLEKLKPLFELPGIRWFHCQKDVAPRDQALLDSWDGRVTPIGQTFGDFADTGAALCALDLVISVDTAMVHLAGALGRPAWLMLPAIPDWRWLLDRDDTPWYPSLRLFRQRSPGDWAGVVEKMRAELREGNAR